MATIKKFGMGSNQFGGFAPYGNVTTLRAKLQTNAAGAVIGGNASLSTALAIGDVIVLGKLTEGMVLEDAQAIVSDAMAASVTGKLGFLYADGVDDATVPQDDAYFITAGANLAATGRLRANSAKKLVKLPKEAFLVLTLAGAANNQVSEIDFVVHGERIGPQG